jgi:hypothetical protein
MTALSVIVSFVFGIAMLMVGILWYKGANRYHEKIRSWLRVDSRYIRQGQQNGRYFGAIFLTIAGLVIVVATFVHIIRLAVN